RIRTQNGSSIDQVTIPTRWTATDIPYVVSDNLEIAGAPGGPILADDGSIGGVSPDSGGVKIDSASTNANALRDNLLGSGVTPVGNATFVGSGTSAGFFSSGKSTIGIDSGIVLTTGDVAGVPGPNNSDGFTGFASGTGDANLDSLLPPGGPTTDDT